MEQGSQLLEHAFVHGILRDGGIWPQSRRHHLFKQGFLHLLHCLAVLGVHKLRVIAADRHLILLIGPGNAQRAVLESNLPDIRKGYRSPGGCGDHDPFHLIQSLILLLRIFYHNADLISIYF